MTAAQCLRCGGVTGPDHECLRGRFTCSWCGKPMSDSEVWYGARCCSDEHEDLYAESLEGDADGL